MIVPKVKQIGGVFARRNLIRQTLVRNMSDAGTTKPTVTRLSSHLELHQYHPSTLVSGEPRPTLVLLPWMNATQSHANRYRELYAIRGFNVVTVWGKLSYFLWPPWAMPLATELADYLDTQTRGPLVIHSMSVGAYLYAVTLAHIADNRDRYRDLISRVKGQVYDSIVVGTLQEMATGVGVIAAPKSPVLQDVVRRVCMLYFAATKSNTVVPYNRFIDVVYNSPIKIPSLCYYSLSDALCQPEAMQRLMRHWRNEYGLQITDKAWDKSPHAAHLRYDPDTYLKLMDNYLKEIGLFDIQSQLQAKL